MFTDKDIDDIVKCSICSNLGKSLKSSLSSIKYDSLIDDILNVQKELICLDLDIMSKYDFRIKSSTSIEKKYEKNLVKGNSIKSTFNDLIGFRFIVNSYDIDIPSIFRVVDMRYGKSKDDGYRGIHLYYQTDNYHYPVEVQLNTKEDRLFADLSHIYLYKKYDNDTILRFRRLFDEGVICDKDTFKKELNKIDRKIITSKAFK